MTEVHVVATKKKMIQAMTLLHRLEQYGPIFNSALRRSVVRNMNNLSHGTDADNAQRSRTLNKKCILNKKCTLNDGSEMRWSLSCPANPSTNAHGLLHHLNLLNLFSFTY